MKKVLMKERPPMKADDYLTDIGWLTFTGESWHYRNLSRHIVVQSAIEYWIEE